MYIVDSLYNVTKNEEKESRYAYRIISEDFYGGQAFGIEAERQDLLLSLIHDNQVSPIHLVDILGEYVDEYVSDFNL